MLFYCRTNTREFSFTLLPSLRSPWAGFLSFQGQEVEITLKKNKSSWYYDQAISPSEHFAPKSTQGAANVEDQMEITILAE